MKLIILNYSMNSRSPIFAHQHQVATALSSKFQSTVVFTLEKSDAALPENIEERVIQWSPNHNFRNILSTVFAVVPFILKNRDCIVFSHMTDGLSAILSPFTFLLRIQHCLWYAHAHNSLKLTFSSFFVDKIVSSTIGSCRLSINKKKVVYINQGVEESLFPFQEISDTNYSSFLYFGRLDPSKNIGALLEFITNIKLNSSEVSLDLYGQSSNEESAKYLSQMKIAHRELFECGSVVLFNPISRNEIYTLRSKYDLFINLYDGSLDKTLIEATMLGFPVMTWNLEYCRDFGTWSGTTPGKTLSFLLSEYWYVSNLDLQEIRRETKRRQLLAITLHSFSKWIDRLFIELVSHDF